MSMLVKTLYFESLLLQGQNSLVRCKIKFKIYFITTCIYYYDQKNALHYDVELEFPDLRIANMKINYYQ